MDLNQWKQILFDWIKGTVDTIGFLEHIQLDDYFDLFYHKIHPVSNDKGSKIDIKEFLNETYPGYDILYDETNKISSQDFVYIFSLLLHYSCVREKSEPFQIACTKLDSKSQVSVVEFLGYIDQQSLFSKEVIRTGIKQAISTMSPLQTKYYAINSPLRTPRKSDISPPTPSKDFINARLNELHLVKAQLENEKFERNSLENEVKENHEKIDRLVRKCRDLNHEVQTLKAMSPTDYNNNNSQNTSPSKAQRDSQFRRKMQKEIQQREDVITDLKYEVENVNKDKKKCQEKINAMEKQMKEMRLKILELDASVDDLMCNMTVKEQKICALEEERKELMDFINETRSSSAHVKDISSDCLDFSCSTSLYTTSSDFGESLAKSVVEVQLKEKENEILKLNEQLSSSNKKINDLESTMRNLEIELSDEKVSKVKLFDEKSKEIQLIQNQLNSTTQENLKIQREIDTKQKLNLKMLEESDAYKEQLENLTKEMNDLKEQKLKRDKQWLDVELQLKNSKDNENMLNQQLIVLGTALEEFSISTERFEENAKKMDVELKAKTDKIEELTDRLAQIEKDLESQAKESDDKLAAKTNQCEMLRIKLLELETIQLREQMFNDEVSKNNEILKSKLTKAREDLAEQKKQSEQEREGIAEYKRKVHGDMVKKLDGYKSEMAAKCNKIVDDGKQKDEKLTLLENQNNSLKKQLDEKDVVVKNFDLLISKFKDEIEEHKKKIKNLTLDLEQEKRDKEFISSKLRFLEMNNDKSYKTLDTVSSELAENFDDQFLNDLKNGAGFDDSPSICSASIFQQRNSQYPHHLRDSYVIQQTDNEISEHDMKSGKVKNNTPPSSPTNENIRKRKQGTNYQRPGPQTPSKGRLSVSANTNILKDTTNTDHVEKISTPKNFFKSMASRFSKPKDELYGKNIRSLTPKRLRNQKDNKWIIEKDTTDSDENIKCNRKVKELDRREKREKARDLNRPNLNDDCNSCTDSSTICSSDTDWIEECTEEEERHSNTSMQHDKSLEYIKNREMFRKHQQKMRRRSFTKNRSSILKNHKIPVSLSRMSYDDFDKFKSCSSLRSESSMALNSITHTPKKSYTRNFINTHLAEVERISDYYVHPSPKALNDNKKKTDNFWNFNFKDIQKPFPLVVIIMLTILLISLLINNNFNHK